MATAENEKTHRGKQVHKKYGSEAKMARLMSDQEYLQKKERTLREIKETLVKNRTTFTADDEISKNEDAISMIDKSIFQNDALLNKSKNSIAEIKDMLSKQPKPATEHHVMKRVMLDANVEMVSWIMEGYALQTEYIEPSPLSDCLVTLMRQPSCCKISLNQSKVVSKNSAELSDEMRHALFHDGSDNQHRFSVDVEFLALSFIQGANFRSSRCDVYGRYDTIMQIGMHFLDGVDEINPTDGPNLIRSGSESINKIFCSNGGTVTPYRDLSSQPKFQFGKKGKFPCFLMEASDVSNIRLAIDDLKEKVERLNERTFSGLPFYIFVVISRNSAQFFLSEYDRPIKELGERHYVGKRDGAASFLLAFLNLLPIFSRFQKILDECQPVWNINTTTSSGVITPISEKRYINTEEYVHHFYFQKKVDSTHEGVSSWEDLLHIYTRLAEKPVPDSLATPMKGQNLAEIFTSDAKTFTLRLIPVAFPGPAETFLTTYRLVGQCFYDILSALMWLHAQNIVHRDVVGSNILKKICKKGFILTGFECSARSGGKFSRDVRNDDELPSRFTQHGSADTDKWFPLDDMEQLCKFLESAIRMVSPSHQNLYLFESLFDQAAIDSAYRKLIDIEYQPDTSEACSKILHEIDACFKKYKYPF